MTKNFLPIPPSKRPATIAFLYLWIVVLLALITFMGIVVAREAAEAGDVLMRLSAQGIASVCGAMCAGMIYAVFHRAWRKRHPHRTRGEL